MHWLLEYARGVPVRYGFHMKKVAVAISVFAVLFGAFLFVYGGYDDSPGGQLLGLLLVIGGVVGAIRSRRKRSR